MKDRMIFAMTLTAMLSCGGVMIAQGPPAGSTGQCKDGSYTQAKEKGGACRGHQGIKEWYAPVAAPAAKAAPAAPAASPAPAAAAKPAATPAPSAPAAPKASPAPAAAASAGKMSPQERAAATPQAPGGGPGLVWFNADSKVYHCPGTTYYGKTKQGQYTSEADAKAKGGHPDHNHPCTK